MLSRFATTNGALVLVGALSLGLGAGETQAAKKKKGADAEAPAAAAQAPAATPTVTLTDKADLKAEPTEIGKVLKKLKKKDKVEFLEKSPDGKWAKIRKGKLEGWVQVEVVDGLPATEAAKPTEVAKPVEPEKKPDAPPPKPTPEVVKAPPVEPAKPVKPVEKHPEPVVVAPPVEPAKPVSPQPEKPPVVVEAPPTKPEPAKPARPGISGFFLSVGGGAGLVNTGMTGTLTSGTQPELYNYSVENLPAFGLQARLGYTFAWKGLRVGIDAGYRFAGGTSIVIQLPDRDSAPYPGAGGGPMTQPLTTPRQNLATTAHDGDAAINIGGYIRLPKRLELGLRARAGVEVIGLLPEFNAFTPLPQEIIYGPTVGAIVDFQTAFTPGFTMRLEGGGIPYGIRLQNSGLRDGTAQPAKGFYVGGTIGARIINGFDVEVGYRMLDISGDFESGSVAERYNLHDRDRVLFRDLGIQTTPDTIGTATRTYRQQTVTLNLVFFRH